MAATIQREISRVKTVCLVFGSGAVGWWVVLSQAEIFPKIGYWTERGLLLAAVIAMLMSWKGVDQMLEPIIEKWVNRNGYRRADILEANRKKAAKFAGFPLLFWWLPVVFAFVDMVTGRLCF